jgi:pyruvate, orthophosphate dikinase
MFFAQNRLDLMRGFILSETPEQRCKYLSEMLPLQQNDFEKIMRLFPNKQVTIRLLDPPLHEFLPPINSPTFFDDIQAISDRLGMDGTVSMIIIDSRYRTIQTYLTL